MGEFTEFWQPYPRKVGRRYAEQCYQRLTGLQKVAACLALPLHVKLWRLELRESSKIPHASTWLNGWRWEDSIEEELERYGRERKVRAESMWWTTEAGTIEKGRQLELHPRAGEAWEQFRARVREAVPDIADIADLKRRA